MKDIQPCSENFKIEAASDGVSCENTMENFDRLVAHCRRYAKIILDKNSISVPLL